MDSQNSIPLRWKLILGLVTRLPQGLISRFTGSLAAIPIPGPFRRLVLGAFARAVGIDVAEAEKPLGAYPSVSHFFTRRLRAGVRSWPSDPTMPASPVDGRVGAVGRIRNGEAIQAKGISYQVAELLGFESPRVSRLEGGTFVTLYLSPRDYHRIHAPVGGEVTWGRILPGALFPVNAPAVASIPRLFPRNERLVAWLETMGSSPESAAGSESAAGPESAVGSESVGGPEPVDGPEPVAGPSVPVAVVAVGAFNVGGISALYDPAWHRDEGAGRSLTNRPGKQRPRTRRYESPKRVARGDEFMAFHLGSTVVLLFGPDDSRGDLDPGVRPGETIRLGAPLFR
ncbi:MAG: phosphatidylserine decarboxylase [Gemmatimonadales bacterium]|nr:MAG: phosphatidylserine decarboxylase [Gemmatimonadales bacterium]